MKKAAWMLLAAAAVGTFGVTEAAEGRRPIWEPTVIAPGSGPAGKYFVTRDLVSPGGPVITIVGGPGIEDVEIDLNGFTLFGDGSGSPTIEVSGPIRRVTIRNGEVRDGSISFIETERVTVEDVQVASSPDFGLSVVDALSLNVRRATVVASGDTGIFTANGGPTVTGAISHTVVRDSTADAIRIEGGHAAFVVEHTRIEVCGGAGIHMLGGAGFLLSQNTVTGCTDGIRAEANNNSKIYNNVVTRNSRNGMSLLTLGGFLVLDNSASFNGADGIFIEGFTNKLENNSMMFNAGFGLRFGPGSSDNLYGKNGARLNGGGACAFVAPVEPCGPAGGGGSTPPDFCNEGAANTSYCDNLMPGPPLS